MTPQDYKTLIYISNKPAARGFFYAYQNCPGIFMKDIKETKEGKRLIVVDAFGDYRRGDAISDKDEIEKVLRENGHRVNVIYVKPELSAKSA